LQLFSGPESKQTAASVTMRMHPSRPQSVFHETSSRVTQQRRPLSSSSPSDPAHLLAEVTQAHSKPHSGSATSPILYTLQTRQDSNSPVAKPADSASTSTSPVLTNLTAKQAADSTSPSSLSDPDLLASPSANSPALASGSPVTYKQFVELKDRVSKLCDIRKVVLILSSMRFI